MMREEPASLGEESHIPKVYTANHLSYFCLIFYSHPLKGFMISFDLHLLFFVTWAVQPPTRPIKRQVLAHIIRSIFLGVLWLTRSQGKPSWMLYLFSFTSFGYGDMGLSKNRGGPPKSSILVGFSLINHPFSGVSYFWKHPYWFADRRKYS